MVKFKVVRYKHYKMFNALSAKVKAGEADEDDVLKMTISEMVLDWDFVDPDTKEPIPINPDVLDELTSDQIDELSTIFEEGQTGVPKANA